LDLVQAGSPWCDHHPAAAIRQSASDGAQDGLEKAQTPLADAAAYVRHPQLEVRHEQTEPNLRRIDRRVELPPADLSGSVAVHVVDRPEAVDVDERRTRRPPPRRARSIKPDAP
jgi:hypothetical protein